MMMSGRSSGVEHNLAKVRVGRSNRLARSKFFNKINTLQPRHFNLKFGTAKYCQMMSGFCWLNL